MLGLIEVLFGLNKVCLRHGIVVARFRVKAWARELRIPCALGVGAKVCEFAEALMPMWDWGQNERTVFNPSASK